MKDRDYIVIQAPMVSKLNLSGNNLIIFALIHGYTKDGVHKFTGSIDYICKWTNLSRPSVIATLKALTLNGFINKEEEVVKGVKFCAYTTNYDALVEGSKESLLPVKKYNEGSKDSLPNNTILYNDNDKSLSNNKNDNNIEEWRKDFNAYLEIVNKAKLELLSDTNFKVDKEKYYPNLDYELSIEKIVKEYWGTEQGWEKRRKGKSKSLDMVRTLKKAFDYATNRVYKRMQPQQGIATTQQKQSAPKPFNYTRAPLHPMLRFINEKGVLNDGTFIEDGYRYYISPTSGQKYSIPCNASKRPSDKHDFDNLTKMWYIKEQEENSIFNDIW